MHSIRRLYDLTELQRHANRLFGFSAQQSLDLAQPAGANLPPVIVRLPDGAQHSVIPVELACVDEVIQSWDCAFKDLEKSDYVVGQVWGRVGSAYLLLDQIRAHMDCAGMGLDRTAADRRQRQHPILRLTGAAAASRTPPGVSPIGSLPDELNGLSGGSGSSFAAGSPTRLVGA